MLAVTIFQNYPPLSKFKWSNPIVKAVGEFCREFNGSSVFLWPMAGNSKNVTSNLECTGRFSFIQFEASAVCFTNPLMTGRYVGIMTTKSQALQLCEVEIYSRGNSI